MLPSGTNAAVGHFDRQNRRLLQREFGRWHRPTGHSMNDIVGTWRLVSSKAHDDSGTPLAPPYGPKPMGLVMFQSDGRMMTVLCDGRPVLRDGEPRQYMSYAGNYVFDGRTLVTR